MTRLAKVGLILALAGGVTVADAAAQARGVLGIGLGIPVGDFADESLGAAEAGGGTALLGLEWLPGGGMLGLRVDGAYNRFCTAACDEASGDLDVRYRLLNATVNGLLEFPMANARVQPYLIGGVGLYNYKLEGDDAPAGLETETDIGLNAGAGLTYTLGRVGLFAEGRFHNVFAEDADLQYIPVLLGARITLR